MIRLRALFALLLGIGLWIVTSLALGQTRTIYIVAGEGVALTRQDVKDVFLGNKTFSGSTKLVPVANTVGLDDFLQKVLNITPSQLEAVWNKKTFRDGVNPPRVMTSDTAVINFVKQTPGAVGYVTIAPTGVAVIQTY